MIRQILLAVDDSPPGLAAARLAIELAAAAGAHVRAINVISDGLLAERLNAGRPRDGTDHTGEPDAAARQALAATSILRYVTRLAADHGVECETADADGEVAETILREARSRPTDLIVLGRSDQHETGRPYVGGHARHVLEFADRPVLVVPSTAAR